MLDGHGVKKDGERKDLYSC